MHKPFYASGFFYHSASQQILLQQQSHGEEIKFVLFRGKSEKGTEPLAVFKKCVEEAIGSTVDTSSIRPIYDYVHEKFGTHYIFYIEVSEIIPKKLTNRDQTKWISLSKLTKHNMSEQTRHDIIVGERVIRASMEQAAPSASASASAKGWH